MQNKSGFKAEINKRFSTMLSKLALNVFAEEVEEGGSEPTPQNVNFEQMIAQARKEEKDKLYPRIKKAEDEVKTLTASVNKYLLENATLKEELEKIKNKPVDDSKVKELEKEITRLTEENQSLKENTPNEEKIREEIKAEFEVKMYAQEQIAANKDSIVSILIPEITGKTKEEIDSAIANAKEKTASIKKDLGIDVDGDDDTKKKKQTTTTTTTKQKRVPASNPTGAEDGESFDTEYIRNLDPRSKEYAEFRKKLGLK